MTAPSLLARVRDELRLRRYARLVRRSGLFDAAFYAGQRPDAAAARDPIRHYLVRGARDGLDPSPVFDTSFYLEQWPELAASGKNPLVDFIRHGARARRPTSGRLEVAERGALQAVLPERVLETAPSATGARVLVIDQRVPTPDRDSASVRMSAILKLLRELGHPVTFVSDADPGTERSGEALRRTGVEVLHGFPAALAHLARHGAGYRAALLSSPYVAERYLMAVRAYALGASVIYDTVDLHWVRLGRAADVTGDPVARARSARYRAVERLAAACSDVALTVTPEEREALLREVPGARVEVLPNIHACEDTSRPWAARRDLMFVGSFAHAPNVDGVAWFAEEVLPLVRRELPGIVLHVAGGSVPARVERLRSGAVRVLGHVPSLRPLFEACRVFVAPLRFGAGMKGKIGQSMSHGLPVVTTAVGAEGLMLVEGENALVAEGAAPFAAAVVRLYTDEALWTAVSRASVRHIEQHFSEASAMRRLESLLSAPRPSEAVARAPSRASGGER